MAVHVKSGGVWKQAAGSGLEYLGVGTDVTFANPGYSQLIIHGSGANNSGTSANEIGFYIYNSVGTSSLWVSGIQMLPNSVVPFCLHVDLVTKALRLTANALSDSTTYTLTGTITRIRSFTAAQIGGNLMIFGLK
jgi:hypothetical protein